MMIMASQRCNKQQGPYLLFVTIYPRRLGCSHV
jgi:hypothetical protein